MGAACRGLEKQGGCMAVEVGVGNGEAHGRVPRVLGRGLRQSDVSAARLPVSVIFPQQLRI